MSNGSLSHTMATRAEIIDANTIKISVDLRAFMPNEIIEISGYATQHHGAFAHFNEFRRIHAPLGDTTTLDVKATLAHGSPAFQKGHTITVMLRAAKVWVTALDEGDAQQPGIPANIAGTGTVWGTVKGVAAPGRYSLVTSGGNQPGAAPAGSAPAGAGQVASGPWEGNQPGAVPAGAGQPAPDGPPSHEAG